jgi:hypothetical protein
VPVIYHLDDQRPAGIEIRWKDSTRQTLHQLSIPSDVCSEIFGRSGRVHQIEVVFPSSQILSQLPSGMDA